jgi:hypothetical protein
VARLSDRGESILNAMRDQGWTVTIDKGTVTAVSVTGKTRQIPLKIFARGTDPRKLNVILMGLQAACDLQWPWPPGGFAGETPQRN